MKEYVQIIKGHYDNKGAVKAIDILNDKPLTADYMKTRPDIKQRVEKAINTKTYLATYQRGTRLGYTFIAEEDVKYAMASKPPIEGVQVMKDRLKVFAKWLREYSEIHDPYTEGLLEAALRQSNEEAIQKIGDYLEEILAMDDEQIKNELK